VNTPPSSKPDRRFSLALIRAKALPLPVPKIGLPWLPGSIVGISLGCAILVKQNYVNDEATIQHELVHCRQFWSKGLIVHFVRYWFSSQYRQAMEVEAFRAELELQEEAHYLKHLNDASCALAQRYGLKLSEAEARKLLDLS
jgi:hypothetical protein